MESHGPTLWYFAYGSNMQSATLRGRRGVTWTRAIAARLPNWRLVFDKPPLVPAGGAGFANIVREEGAAVFGAAYEITRDDLAHIELTEGVLIDNYRRVEIEVVPLVPGASREPGAPLPVLTLASDRRDPALRPSAVYMARVIEGALEHGLPPDYIELLRRIPTGEESELSLATRALVDRRTARDEAARRRVAATAARAERRRTRDRGRRDP